MSCAETILWLLMGYAIGFTPYIVIQLHLRSIRRNNHRGEM